jgi:hypothetical protein
MTDEEGFKQIKYRLDTLECICPQNILDNSTPQARDFLQKAHDLVGGNYYSSLDKRWWKDDLSLLESFIKLDEISKIYIMAYYTSHIHELRHHIDILSTPFGVNYQTKLCREYINFQDFSKELLRNKHLIKSWVRIIDYESSVLASLDKQIYSSLFETWEAIKGQLYYFDALYNINNWGRRNLVEGWNGNTKKVKILRREFDKVTIRGLFLTIKISDDGEYLTPVAILECRALINSLRWIIWTMGNINETKRAILIYLKNFYAQEDTAYKFIVNLFAKFYGANDLATLIEDETVTVSLIGKLLDMINACCWYALQAPPMMSELSLINSGPVNRLILALVELEEAILKGKSYAHITEFLDEVDRSQRAQYLYVQPISKVLHYCIQFLNDVKVLNFDRNKNNRIRSHFNWILDVQAKHISKRYSFLTSLAENGHPLFDIDEIDEKEFDSLQLVYAPEAEVASWFDNRNNLFFKVLEKNDVIAILENLTNMEVVKITV